jgi:hypothetical protein
MLIPAVPGICLRSRTQTDEIHHYGEIGGMKDRRRTDKARKSSRQTDRPSQAGFFARIPSLTFVAFSI